LAAPAAAPTPPVPSLAAAALLLCVAACMVAHGCCTLMDVHPDAQQGAPVELDCQGATLFGGLP
jgi:hypothetical protein